MHKNNPRVSADLEVTVKHRVPLVITSLGANTEVVDAVHGYGGLAKGCGRATNSGSRPDQRTKKHGGNLQGLRREV